MGHPSTSLTVSQPAGKSRIAAGFAALVTLAGMAGCDNVDKRSAAQANQYIATCAKGGIADSPVPLANGAFFYCDGRNPANISQTITKTFPDRTQLIVTSLSNGATKNWGSLEVSGPGISKLYVAQLTTDPKNCGDSLAEYGIYDDKMCKAVVALTNRINPNTNITAIFQQMKVVDDRAIVNQNLASPSEKKAEQPASPFLPGKPHGLGDPSCFASFTC